MNELKFRKLEAEVVECRVSAINADIGVTLLLYKNARVDQQILDETVGPTHWQRHHSRNNANCIVSIWDDDLQQWIEKEDCGSYSAIEKEKGLASDSFKRACVNWGIGRELYTAPQIVILKSKLKGFVEENERLCVKDQFKVTDIQYDKNEMNIISVTIDVSLAGVVHDRITFSKDMNPSESAMTASVFSPSVSAQPVSSNSATVPRPAVASSGISDDEIILIGNCKGKKYGDVKDTPVFKSFLTWIKTSNCSYSDEPRRNQALRLKEIALKIA